MLFAKQKPTTSSLFSEFMRNASSAEKKRVYGRVLTRATEEQQRVLTEAKRLRELTTE